MRKARLGIAAFAAVVFAAFALAACGDDNGGSSADQDQITAAITRAATGTDPAACTEVQTARFVQQTSGEPGDSAEEALRKCQRQAGDTVADKVDVSEIEIDGDSATAKAAVTGSFFDGQTLDLALVKQGDQWKLDEFKGFEDFDRDAFASSLTKEISKEGGSQQAIDCVTNQVKSSSTEDLEAAFVGNDPKAEDRLFRPCSKYFPN
jgi:hypothetical protein